MIGIICSTVGTLVVSAWLLMFFILSQRCFVSVYRVQKPIKKLGIIYWCLCRVLCVYHRTLGCLSVGDCHTKTRLSFRSCCGDADHGSVSPSRRDRYPGVARIYPRPLNEEQSSPFLCLCFLHILIECCKIQKVCTRIYVKFMYICCICHT